MELNLVPMLQRQRELYDIPRGPERFAKYLETMIGDSDDIALPLPAINPMGKEHVSAVYDSLIELNAEVIAASALEEAERRLVDYGGKFNVGLLVADDAGGGWTNRYYADFSHRFEEGKSFLKRGWIVALFWSSEKPIASRIKEEVLTSVYRAAHVERFGWCKTLRQMLLQEGRAARFAEFRPKVLESEDVDYTREVLNQYLDSSDLPTTFCCLYGDEAAMSVGYQPLGLSRNAGFAIALEDYWRDD
jgi:hypothetical protein